MIGEYAFLKGLCMNATFQLQRNAHLESFEATPAGFLCLDVCTI